MADQGEVAAGFGYSVAFFNSDPELKTLLGQATTGSWSTARFVAALQNTKWFRTKSESYRKYIALQKIDPASYQQQLTAGTLRVSNLGAQMGVEVSPWTAKHWADQAMMFGWSEEQLKNVIGAYIKPGKDGLYSGQAGAFQNKFRQIAADYGVAISDWTMNKWVKDNVLGTDNPERVTGFLQKTAASKYVALADRINAGETVRQIADPYMQSYGKLLEVNPDNLNLDDPLIQRALLSKDKDGKPTTQTVYDFEQGLRNDPRWAQTKNAQDAATSTTREILQTFGLMGR